MTRYTHQTSHGLFAIAQIAGRWHALFQGESYGDYDTPERALDDLIGGHTFSLPDELDSSELDLPDSLEDWDAAAAI